MARQSMLSAPPHARGLPVGVNKSGSDVASSDKDLELIASEERWRFALEGSGLGVWDWDVQTGHVIYSLRWKEMLGYGADEIAPRLEEWSSRLSEEERPAAFARVDAVLTGEVASYTSELRMRCKDGSWKWVLARGMVIRRDSYGNALRMVGTHTDLTAQKQAQEIIWHQANFDPLTNLPNRRMLLEHIEQEVKRLEREGGQLALFFIDLDLFKDINETMGYSEGDRLIVEAASRISACVRSSDIVSRQGGDEFAVVLPLSDGKAHIEQVAQSLLSALGKPYQLENEQVFVTASIGMTVYPQDGKEIETLLKNADQALYAAKAAGRNQFSFFTPHMQRDALNRMHLANDLRSALAKGQLHTVYQPIITLATGRVRKAEALLRWTHPERGAVSPAEFIPIAESSGSIVDIGNWVFEQASQQAKDWRQRIDPDFQVSINKSPVQFLRSQSLGRSWLEYLAEMDIPGQAVAIEITEGMILESSACVMEKLMAYQAYGVSISLDDFGTGYSSLSYLQRYPIGFVKIDKTFVMGLNRQSKNWALCKAIIRMAHELGMEVIAEGIETEEQREMLLEAECDYGQGYLFSKPLPLMAFEAYLAKQHHLAHCSV